MLIPSSGPFNLQRGHNVQQVCSWRINTRRNASSHGEQSPDTSSRSGGWQSRGGPPCHQVRNLPRATLMASPPLTGDAGVPLPTSFFRKGTCLQLTRARLPVVWKMLKAGDDLSFSSIGLWTTQSILRTARLEPREARWTAGVSPAGHTRHQPERLGRPGGTEVAATNTRLLQIRARLVWCCRFPLFHYFLIF